MKPCLDPKPTEENFWRKARWHAQFRPSCQIQLAWHQKMAQEARKAAKRMRHKEKYG